MKTQWVRVRPGLYEHGKWCSRNSAQIERGAEVRPSWWWEVILPNYKSVYGRAPTLTIAKAEAQEALKRG